MIVIEKRDPGKIKNVSREVCLLRFLGINYYLELIACFKLACRKAAVRINRHGNSVQNVLHRKIKTNGPAYSNSCYVLFPIRPTGAISREYFDFSSVLFATFFLHKNITQHTHTCAPNLVPPLPPTTFESPHLPPKPTFCQTSQSRETGSKRDRVRPHHSPSQPPQEGNEQKHKTTLRKEFLVCGLREVPPPYFTVVWLPRIHHTSV